MNDMTKAVNILRSGGLVAIPTETVYGLGADARNPEALRRIFTAKQRPMDHPLIVHLADISQLEEWACEISKEAQLLAQAFWPGPLTLILRKKEQVNAFVTGGQDTVGVRIPRHPVAQALLKAFGGGVAAPSANRFGRISPTTAEAVREELGESVDLVLEGGQCEVGVESTIVDVSGDCPVILRPGMITAAQIEAVLHQSLGKKSKQTPRVSGSLESHYAPLTPTCLVKSEELRVVLQRLTSEEMPVAVMQYSVGDLSVGQVVQMPKDAERYAHDLYSVLRELDKKKFKRIFIECVPEENEWEAVRDRLQRSSNRSP